MKDPVHFHRPVRVDLEPVVHVQRVRPDRLGDERGGDYQVGVDERGVDAAALDDRHAPLRVIDQLLVILVAHHLGDVVPVFQRHLADLLGQVALGLVYRLLLDLPLDRLVRVLDGRGERCVGVVERRELAVHVVFLRCCRLPVRDGGVDGGYQVGRGRVEAVLRRVQDRFLRARKKGVRVQGRIGRVRLPLGGVYHVDILLDRLGFRLRYQTIGEGPVHVPVQVAHRVLGGVRTLHGLRGRVVGLVRRLLGVVRVAFQLVLYGLVGRLHRRLELVVAGRERGVLAVHVGLLCGGRLAVGDGGVDGVDQRVRGGEEGNLGVVQRGLRRALQIGVVVQSVVGGQRLLPLVAHHVDVLLDRLGLRLRYQPVGEGPVHVPLQAAHAVTHVRCLLARVGRRVLGLPDLTVDGRHVRCVRQVPEARGSRLDHHLAGEHVLVGVRRDHRHLLARHRVGVDPGI